MTKRERLEDLGRAYEKMNMILEDEFWDEFQSKHQVEDFINTTKDNEVLAEIHFKLRCFHINLKEIQHILCGDADEPMGRCF